MVSKTLEMKKRAITTFRRNCNVSQYQNMQGNPSVRHYFRLSKIFLLKRVVFRFSIEFFLSKIMEQRRKETLLCFTKKSDIEENYG